jgi:Sulfotransferase domain
MTRRSLRIAMWSGPRNISTALMRAWGSRPDTFVTDEPLYAHYLQTSGAHHPVRDEILASQESDWRRVVAWLTGDIPGGRAVWYQKHMGHHLTPGMDRDWIQGLTNCFLIREPREMITSYIKIVPRPTPHDLALPQQVELFESIRAASGGTPPVIDSRDVLENPRRLLELLCAAVGVDFMPAMLSWEPGLRETDGVWAPHWYGSVARTTTFGTYRSKDEEVPSELRGVLRECDEYYELLHCHRLR